MADEATTGAGSPENSTATGTQGANGGTPSAELTFETWASKWGDAEKSVFDSHVNGLKTALAAERESKKVIEKQLKDLAGKAEKGSELESQLQKLSEATAEAERRASAFDELAKAGVTNLKLAYTCAVQESAFGAQGRIDLSFLKETYPELFETKKPAGRGDAGAGNGKSTPTDPKSAFNKWAREG